VLRSVTALYNRFLVDLGKHKMKFPLMRNNILREDLDAVIKHLQQDDPILTHGANVRAFEPNGRMLGVKYSVFVNSAPQRTC